MRSLQLQAIQPHAFRTLGPPYRANGLVRACRLQAVISQQHYEAHASA